MLLSHSIMSDSLQPHGLPCPLPFSWVFSNSYPLSQQFHPTISPTVVPFFFCLQSFPTSGSFPVSRLFTLVGQSIGASPSASVLPINIQDWFPLGWTGWISLLSKRLSRVFSNTTVQKHQFFGTQLSSQSNSHITNCTTRVQFQKWQNDLSVFKVNHSTSRNLSLCPNQCCWRT